MLSWKPKISQKLHKFWPTWTLKTKMLNKNWLFLRMSDCNEPMSALVGIEFLSQSFYGGFFPFWNERRLSDIILMIE